MKMKMTQKQLFDKSLERWGMESQLLLLAEEASELSVATLHLLRANKPKAEALESFAEEIADVEFMIDEMKYYFQNVPVIAKYRGVKEKRLQKLLEG